MVVVSALAVAPPAWSDEHRGRDDRRERGSARREPDRRERQRYEAEQRDGQWRRAAERHEWERRRELERHRAAAHWRFERERGWRFEHRPGVWSPHFVWWSVGGPPILRPYPTVRIVRYSTGYYELIGDGFTAPFHWVWRPTVVVTPRPPLPLPPPPPAEYPFPPTGVYPPPPQG
jgi:hypothetical protein